MSKVLSRGISGVTAEAFLLDFAFKGPGAKVGGLGSQIAYV